MPQKFVSKRIPKTDYPRLGMSPVSIRYAMSRSFSSLVMVQLLPRGSPSALVFEQSSHFENWTSGGGPSAQLCAFPLLENGTPEETAVSRCT